MTHDADVRHAAKTRTGRSRRGAVFWGEDRRYKGLSWPSLLRALWRNGVWHGRERRHEDGVRNTEGGWEADGRILGWYKMDVSGQSGMPTIPKPT